MKRQALLLVFLVTVMLGLAIGTFIYASAPAEGAEPPPARCKDRHSHAYCLVVKYWKNGPQQDKALDVVDCESGFSATATGSARERGVFQIHPTHKDRIASLGYTWDDMYDAGKNTVVAESLFRDEGWGPWSCA